MFSTDYGKNEIFEIREPQYWPPDGGEPVDVGAAVVVWAAVLGIWLGWSLACVAVGMLL